MVRRQVLPSSGFRAVFYYQGADRSAVSLINAGLGRWTWIHR